MEEHPSEKIRNFNDRFDHGAQPRRWLQQKRDNCTCS
jgi:hypothetical protein